jgi:hypothetical protein
MQNNYLSKFNFTYGYLEDGTIWIDPPSHNVFRIDKFTLKVVLDINSGISIGKICEKYGLSEREIEGLIEKFDKEGAINHSGYGKIIFLLRQEDISLDGYLLFFLILVIIQIDYFQTYAHTYLLMHLHEGIILALIAIGCVFFHELGHYLLARKYFRSKPKFGFTLQFIFPAVYVQTQQLWCFPKNIRLLINSVGVFSDFLVNTIAIILAIIFPQLEYYITPFLITQYTRISMVLNPLFPTDGYWILSDLTGSINLRNTSIENLKNLKLNWYSIYGLISLLFMLMSLVGFLWFLYNILHTLIFKIISYIL